MHTARKICFLIPGLGIRVEIVAALSRRKSRKKRVTFQCFFSPKDKRFFWKIRKRRFSVATSEFLVASGRRAIARLTRSGLQFSTCPPPSGGVRVSKGEAGTVTPLRVLGVRNA